jgi:hypothetical protein
MIVPRCLLILKNNFMKRIVIELQRFRNYLNFLIIEKFTKQSATPAKICKNQELLANGLKLCYTIHDVKLVRELFDIYRKDFTTTEALKFNIEILYRQTIIEIMDKNFPTDERYQVVHVQRFFKNANYKQCDAIMLHITYNKDHYIQRLDGLRIFQEMWTNRKFAIIQSIENEHKQTA